MKTVAKIDIINNEINCYDELAIERVVYPLDS
jgi:hypothetical protein